jgi:hypothetical protein
MTCTRNRIALSALLAASMLVHQTGRADAGSVSLTVTPQGESAEAVRTGFMLYNLFRGFKNSARVDQKGSGNGAAISQHGRGNFAEVFQRGRGHSGTITQSGNHNAYGIFQFGRNARTSAVQRGDGNVGFTFQGNW